jgi:predicted methyltransferase
MAFGRRPWRALFLTFLAVAVMTAAGSPRAAGQSGREGDRGERQRDSWQRVDEIFAGLRLKPGSRVADVGAGGGFFTVRLAGAVGPTGRVFAVDVSPSVIRDLRARVERERLANVDVIRGEPDDPNLPPELDGVLIVNAYHEMDRHHAMLVKIRTALRPDGRLVIVEPISRRMEESARATQQARHEIAAHYVVADLIEAGFTIENRIDRFVKRPQDNDIEWMIVARPGQ